MNDEVAGIPVSRGNMQEQETWYVDANGILGLEDLGRVADSAMIQRFEQPSAVFTGLQLDQSARRGLSHLALQGLNPTSVNRAATFTARLGKRRQTTCPAFTAIHSFPSRLGADSQSWAHSIHSFPSPIHSFVHTSSRGRPSTCPVPPGS